MTMEIQKNDSGPDVNAFGYGDVSLLDDSIGEPPNFLIETLFDHEAASRREFLDLVQKVLGVDSDESIVPQIRANQKAVRYWRQRYEGAVAELRKAAECAALQTERAATWRRDAETAEVKLKQMTGGVTVGADECRDFTPEEVTRDDAYNVTCLQCSHCRRHVWTILANVGQECRRVKGVGLNGSPYCVGIMDVVS